MMTSRIEPLWPLVIDHLRAEDWPEVREIYLQGIATGLATFATEAPNWEQWNAEHLPHCRLVGRGERSIAGWAALSPTSRRAVYAGVAEVSIYVAAQARGLGVGDRLMRSLVDESEAHGIWTLQSSVFPENRASINLHLKYGFRELGWRERIARHHDGVWRDTIILERRSRLVGID